MSRADPEVTRSVTRPLARLAVPAVGLLIASFALPALARPGSPPGAGPRPAPTPALPCGDPVPLPCPSPSPSASPGDLPALPRGIAARGCDPDRVPVRPGEWTRYGAVAYAGYPDTYGNASDRVQQRVRKETPFALVVDPFRPCRLYRVGTQARGFADRNVVERSEDSGRTWTPVLTAAPSFRARYLYVPRPDTVWVAEYGDGSAVVASTDAGGSWRYRHGGTLAGRRVYDLTFDPARPLDVYAITLDCDPLPTSCRPDTTLSDRSFLGRVEVWSSTDGGGSWAPVPLPDPDAPRNELVVRADPAGDGAVFVYDQVDGEAETPPASRAGGPVVRVSADRGRTWQTNPAPGRIDNRADFFAVVPTPAGPVRLFVGPHVSDDRARSFRKGPGHLPQTEPYSWVARPGSTGLFAFVPFRFAGPSASGGGQGRAVWYDDPSFDRLYQSAEPPPSDLLPPLLRPGFFVEDVQYDLVPGRAPVYYVRIAVYCDYADTSMGERDLCDAPGGPRPHAWYLLRYQPRSSADAEIARIEAFPDPPASTGDLTERRRCQVGAGPGAGLAFVAGDLLHPAPGPASDPYAVTVRRVDPRTCEDRGDVAIALDPGDYGRARALTARSRVLGGARGRPPMTPTLPERYPLADALAYDPAEDALYFGLRENGTDKTPQGTPAAVWVAKPLHGPGGRPAVARLLFAGERCLDHDADEPGGMEVLAFDAGRSVLYACRDARPAPLDRTGVERPVNRCFQHPAFRGQGGPDWWTVTSVTPVDGDRALLLVEEAGLATARLVVLDLATCEATAFGATPVAAVRGDGVTPRFDVATQLACDPTTYPGETVLWQRWHGTLVAWRLPGGRWCRVGTTTRILPRSEADVRAGRVCAAAYVAERRLAEPVSVAVDGGRAGTGCVTDLGLAEPGRHRVVARFAGTAGLYPSAADAWVRVAAPAAPVPAAPAVPRLPVREEPVPPVLPPPVVPAPQPAAAPAAPVPAPQPPAVNAAGVVGERQKQAQLALVEQSGESEPEEAAELAAVGLDRDDAAAQALLLGAACAMTAVVGIAQRRRSRSAPAR